MGRKGHAKDALELARLCANDANVRVVERRTKHWMVFVKDASVRPVRIPITPSDWRSLENCKAELRRAGVTIPHKGQGR
jgi:hypothetical protein